MIVKILILLFATINGILGMDWKAHKLKTFWIIIILVFIGILSVYQYIDEQNVSDNNKIKNENIHFTDSLNIRHEFQNILESQKDYFNSQRDEIAGQLIQLGFKIDKVNNRIIKVNDKVMPDSTYKKLGELLKVKDQILLNN